MSAKRRKRLEELGDGIWRWAAPHPSWHPGEFGAEVASYALRQGSDTVLVDPLVADERPDDLCEELDEIVTGRLMIAITLGYHVRSTVELAERYRGSRRVDVLGPAAAGSRLGDGVLFRAISAGDRLPHGISAHRIGSPVRGELPLLFPESKAIVFGDTIVEQRGRLRLWEQRELTEKRRRWNTERLIPTLEPLLELEFERVLVTHGYPVLRGGRRALAMALQEGPWYHRG